MLPIWFKYLDPIIKKKIKNKFFENRKFEIKQRRIGPIKKRIFDPSSHKKKTKKMRPARLKSTEWKLRSRRICTHTHTSIQRFFKNHVFWFLPPQKTIITCFYNNSKNYYHKASSRRKQFGLGSLFRPKKGENQAYVLSRTTRIHIVYIDIWTNPWNF